MSDVNNLRDEARKRQKAVAAKIARIKKTTGADVNGSEFDPRRDASLIKRYNARQLNTYIGELNNFMRRPNQFVGGVKGAPIPRGQYLRYKQAEAEYEKARLAHDESVGSVVTPTGMTVRQNKAAIPETTGSAVYGPYRKFDRNASDFTSANAVELLRKDLLNRATPDFLSSKIQQGRGNLKKVLIILGEYEYVDRIDKLTDYQFDLLWYGTTVAESVFMQYGIEKERAAGTRKERWQDKVVESAAGELGDVLEWVESQPKERPTGTATNKKAPRFKK